MFWLGIAAGIVGLFLFLAGVGYVIELRHRYRSDLASVTAKFANAQPGDRVFVSISELAAMDGKIGRPYNVSLIQHPRHPDGIHPHTSR